MVKKIKKNNYHRGHGVFMKISPCRNFINPIHWNENEMQSDLQQQRQNVKKEEHTSPDIQTSTENDGQKTGICPNCQAGLPEEALFCPECGLSIKQRVCPKCGAPASATADICQSCGAWLLEGKCKFCNADLTSDYAVCNFNKLSKKHSPDTIYDLIRLLYKPGADVNEYSGDGTCPLINVYDTKNKELTKLLLELGADINQYRAYKKRIAEQERREQECLAEEKRKEQEHISFLAEIRKKITRFHNCISVGDVHTVGLKADGTVVAVGQN
jgi:ribosomal protein L40E